MSKPTDTDATLDAEGVQLFLQECTENLDTFEAGILALERDPSSPETINQVFRAVHTIKGTCAYAGFSLLERLTHTAENLLAPLRDGRLAVTADAVTALLATVDAVRKVFARIAATGGEGDEAFPELIDRLEALKGGGKPRRRGKGLPARPRAAKKSPRRKAAPAPKAAEAEPAPPMEPVDLGADGPGQDGFLRVDVDLLDALMNLVGELVLARNQVMRFTDASERTEMATAAQHLSLITSELQEGIMKTRLQVIDQIWRRFPRQVRDLARTAGKEVCLRMEGRETELDRSLIEALKDPLTHMLRNSIDHGIETPDVRTARGKPAEGTITLHAYHEGGQVNIDIVDDGAGIDAGKVAEKAIEKSLVTAQELERMSEQEVLHLIFLPGFSTAEKATRISGRGVGMDVVKASLDKLGGRIDLETEPGRSTRIRLKIPLTLAIIPALIVTSGGDCYAIPQVSLIEIVKLGKDGDQGCEMMHDAPVYRLRGNLLPLVFLHDVLRGEAPAPDAASALPGAPEPEANNIVVLSTGSHQFGLVVGGISDTQEIVVKPLGRHLKEIPAFSGATILGDGRVGLILDVLRIAERAHVVAEEEQPAAEREVVAEGEGGELHTLLLIQDETAGRLAVALPAISRLEEFPVSSIEQEGARDVIQYRDQIVPLIYLSEVFGNGSSGVPSPESRPVNGQARGKERMQVVMCAVGGEPVGLVVGKIVDIVEERITVQHGAARAGVQSSAVVQDRVTEILSVEAVAELAGLEQAG